MKLNKILALALSCALLAQPLTMTASATELDAEEIQKYVGGVEVTEEVKEATEEEYEQAYAELLEEFKEEVGELPTAIEELDEEALIAEELRVEEEMKNQPATIANDGIPLYSSQYFRNLYLRSYLREFYDLDGDGFLSDFEISCIKVLIIDSDNYGLCRYISTLEGIEYLTSLTGLAINSGSMTSLDVSKNTKLETLLTWGISLDTVSIGTNSNLNKIFMILSSVKSVDVSKTVNLEEFLMAFNYSLTSVNFASNTKLKDVDLMYTGISSLDVSKCTNLQSLKINHALTSLDLSKNLSLVELDADKLAVKVMDLSKHSKLTTLSMEKSDVQRLYLNQYISDFAVSRSSGTMDVYRSQSVSAWTNHENSSSSLNWLTWNTSSMPRVYASAYGRTGYVTLAWDKVPNATGYVVYGRTESGKYEYRGLTTGYTWTDTKASTQDYNFYWVYPYYKASTSSSMSIATSNAVYVYAKATQVSAVSRPTASSLSGGVKLSWTASTGADGYLVYGRRAGGAYSYIGMTTSTTFTDTKASSIEYNYYWVYPYSQDQYGNLETVTTNASYTYGRAL